jgi:hypothetical protein
MFEKDAVRKKPMVYRTKPSVLSRFDSKPTHYHQDDRCSDGKSEVMTISSFWLDLLGPVRVFFFFVLVDFIKSFESRILIVYLVFGFNDQIGSL